MRHVLCLFLLLSPSLSFSAVHHVPSEHSTIQEGIDACVVGDTVLVAPGTYSGPGNHDLNFSGRDLVVMSSEGSDSTIIDLMGDVWNAHPAFRFTGGESRQAIVQGFRIHNGYTDPQEFLSGGIHIVDSSPTCRDLRFWDNDVFSTYPVAGGAIHSDGGSPRFEDCRVAGTSHGSAVVLIGGAPEFEDVSIHSNYGAYHEYHYGIGMTCSSSDASLVRVHFYENGSYYGSGGGLYIGGEPSPTLRECSFEANGIAGTLPEGQCFGGGLAIEGSSPEIVDCTFKGNAAWAGSAISCYSAAPRIRSSRFLENRSDHAAVYLVDTQAVIENCTFQGNGADYMGGDYGGDIRFAGGGEPLIMNSLFHGTWSGASLHGDSLQFPAVECCLFHDNVDGVVDGGMLDPLGSSGNFTADPLFCDLPVGDLTLHAESPCLPGGNACNALIGAFGHGCGEATSVSIPPSAFAVKVAPNPFNPSTRIRLTLPSASRVSVHLHDITGRHVRALLDDEPRPAGEFDVVWDGRDASGHSLASGIYLCKVSAGSRTTTRKLTLIK